jgi:hypothetical protein
LEETDKKTEEELEEEVETLEKAYQVEKDALDDAVTEVDTEASSTALSDGEIAKHKLEKAKANLELFLNGRNGEGIHLFLEDDENSVELPILC